MARKKQQIEVIDMGGAKTVAKKKSLVRGVRRGIAIFTIIWFAFIIWAPLHIKNTYSQPIKKSIVVSMFFDLQKGIVKQYEALLDSVADAVDLEKPIGVAIDGVKLVEQGVDKVTDATARAKEQTAKATDATADAREKTSGVKKLSGFAKMFGVNTDGVDKVSAVVQNNSATAQQSAAASEELSGQAEMLKEMLDKFKL